MSSSFSAQFISPAVAFYRVFANTKQICNCFISAAFTAQFGYFSFLLICHEIVLQSENSCPHYPLEKKKPIVQKMSKKNYAYRRDNLQ